MERASQAVYMSLCMMLGLKSACRAGEKQQEAEDKQEPHLTIPNPEDAGELQGKPGALPQGITHASGSRSGEARRGDGGSCATCQLGNNVHEQ